ncbi:OLC1v1030524C1 [Oldenlandia corymbosa var. corymbosa]|uniref:OLC1v1030524C1 n=1 Tax=Oldenlandia corymbosa var. corymbosa TaxID=529605 RepID=A0AAV1CJK8_OLDCO|nr:OLC1v1030524C1 [Oldenlandia corymbosa var. corymbosa]
MAPHPIHEANKNSPYGDLSREGFYKKHQILNKQSFIFNNKNLKIFTQSWQPADSTSKLKGLVAMLHGYSAESSWLFELNAVAMAREGYFVCALDLQGHGYSDGSPGIIPDFLSLVSDSIQFFDSVRKEHPKLPAFLYGESLGGAISAIICLRQKNEWNGLILSGAMFSVWKDNLPQPVALELIKEGWKNKLTRKSPNFPTTPMMPIPKITRQEFIKACIYIERRSHELEVPLLILHGGADTVCDPQAAKFVFESAASKDKSMNIFPGMWHQLTGEPNESVELVFEIMFSWIDVRAKIGKITQKLASSL